MVYLIYGIDGKGNISIEAADRKALLEYKEFNKTQKIDSDFEKVIKKLGVKSDTL